MSIIVAFSKMEDAKIIKNALIRNDFDVSVTCTTGSQTVSIANELDGGIVISGYRFSDMHYYELFNYLPRGFELLLIASPARMAECINNNIICLSAPFKMDDLISTIKMMSYNYSRRKKKEKEQRKLRTEEEKVIINKAKVLLMERNNMSEEEAHRYIQKNSMDGGINMVEMAEMILSLI